MTTPPPTTPSTPPTKPYRYTEQLLLDLATNPLDPGYAAAAERRKNAPARNESWFDRSAVAIGCLLIGFTLVVAYVHTHRSAPESAKVHDSLVKRVQAQDKEAKSLAARAQRLNSQLNALRDSALSGDLGQQLGREQLGAGEVAVTGPGLEARLTEPKQSSAAPTGGRGDGSIASSSILTDRDVRSVVNELWADGAEAIAVNGIRLTPTSAIRFAGEAVLVDFQPITSPYVISAIGNADDLATSFASSDVASRYQTLSSAEGVGFAFSEHKKLSLPAGNAETPRFAILPTPSPTPGATR
ncbi:MAG TPA: DUF881 domain-containing protein [Jatrophihabitantaceae bacterium]|nr:DUF881 domain-containing protein [Jatrophihabitantaceae bacterium]